MDKKLFYDIKYHVICVIKKDFPKHSFHHNEKKISFYLPDTSADKLS